MSFFKSMFGSKPKPPPAPTVNEALQKNKQVLEQMDKKLLLLNHQYEQENQNAKKLHAASRGKREKNPRLMASLKKMKQYESQISQLEAQRSNLDAQMTTLDNLAMSKMMVEAVQLANQATRAQMEHMNPDQVADVIDDAADLQDDMQEVADVLAEPTGINATLDEDDLYDEFLEDLDAEQAFDLSGQHATLPDTPIVDPMPHIPAQPVPSMPAAPVDEDEDEFARLEREMMGA